MLRFLIAPAVLLLTAYGFAQDVPPPSPSPAPAQEAPPEPEYGGPAILSRGGLPSIRAAGEQLRLRPYVSANGIYDSGLGTISIDQQGQVPFTGAYGVETTFGVMGTHPWRRTVLDLDYRGAFRHYNQKTYYDGMDNSLTLGVSHELSRHVQFTIGETAASYQRAFFLPIGSALLYDPTFYSLTSNDLFDSPTNVLMTNAQLVYQRTARLSFGAGGNGFIMRRRSAAFVGANGYNGRGDMAYRLSRYQTVGLEYNFSHYDFQRAYGSSDIHGLAVNYSMRIGRHWELAVRAGAFRVEAKRLQQVQLDPAIAAILGQSVGVEAFHRVTFIPHYDAHLTRVFRRGSLSINYQDTVAPGNGVYLTSGYETGTVGYAYTGIRRLSLQTDVGYSSYSSLSQTLGKYRSYVAGGGVSIKTSRTLSLITRVDARRYYIGGANLNHIYYRTLVGFAWSPGDYPLAIW